MPTISVIIPARNEEKRIGIAVDSAFNQDRPPDEVVVVDDCSTDSTSNVAENHGSTVIPERGRESVGRNNWVLRHARGTMCRSFVEMTGGPPGP